uniref:Uncharacterized protein n=1 Tax=Emiliania huxleyi (strain CCMP1516) TaxID=280463 RepID=A0A0D3J4A0_EMIH1
MASLVRAAARGGPPGRAGRRYRGDGGAATVRFGSLRRAAARHASAPALAAALAGWLHRRERRRHLPVDRLPLHLCRGGVRDGAVGHPERAAGERDGGAAGGGRAGRRADGAGGGDLQQRPRRPEGAESSGALASPIAAAREARARNVRQAGSGSEWILSESN